MDFKIGLIGLDTSHVTSFTEILNKDRVRAALFVGPCIRRRRLEHGFQVSRPSRRPRERMKMDHADQELWVSPKQVFHRALCLPCYAPFGGGMPGAAGAGPASRPFNARNRESAASAASLSAAFLLLPRPRANSTPV